MTISQSNGITWNLSAGGVSVALHGTSVHCSSHANHSQPLVLVQCNLAFAEHGRIISAPQKKKKK